MSFILDALKKADRERHLNKIPTLATVHIPVYVRGRRVAVWAVAALLLGTAGLVWWLQPSTEAPVSTVQPLPSVAITPPARPSNPERGPASDRMANVPRPVVPESAVPAPRAAAPSGAQRQAGRDRTVSPGPTRPAPQPLSQPPVAPIRPEVHEVRPARVDPPAIPSPRPEPQ
jgi:general secretion pathway protein B